jgi:putative transposase
VRRNKKVIEEHIRNQIQEDIEHEQFSLKEYMNPFMDEPVNGNKK